MAVEAVVFDVGETLVDETNMWMRAAEAAGHHAVHADGRARRDDRARAAARRGLVDARRRAPGRDVDDGRLVSRRPSLPRAPARRRLPRVRLRQHAGVRRAATSRRSSTRSASSESLGVWKPAPEFFERSSSLPAFRLRGSRTWATASTTTSAPAIAAGMTGVHIRRGPWGYLQEPPADAIRIDSLDELPEVLP